MKIYTKTGDKGQTSLLGGQRVGKDDLRLQTYGTVDELNSHIGLLIAHIKNELTEYTSEVSLLTEIQNHLFLLGSHTACAQESDRKRFKLQDFDHSKIDLLESSIDSTEKNLPPLKNFVIPGGCLSSSQAHVCRTICRRAERLMVTLNDDDKTGLIYLNRLSDYFFTLARHLNHVQNIEDVPWIQK